MATLSTRPNNQNFIPTSSNPSFPSSDINQHHDSSSYGYSDSTSGAEDKNGDTNTATDTYADNTAAFSDVSDRGGLAPSNSNPNSTNFATSTLPAHSPVRPSLGSAAPYSPDSLAVGNSNSPLPPTLLHVSFNQDYGCFAAGTDRGFRIYNCDPFREIFRRDFQVGRGIGKVEMLYRYNILALVGGGPDPQYPVNKVMVWDDHQSRCIGELAFRSEVRGVRLRRDRIVVVLDHKVYVYNFADLKLLHQIETIANPKGLCEVSQTASNFVLVCPGLQKGQVRVEHYASKRTKFIMAHDSRVACFALNQDGSILATASSKGTLIRIFKTLDGTLLQEVRRGVDRAEIYSLAFSPSAQWLGVSSDKGTIHVFNLKINSGTPYNESMQVAPEASPPVSPSGSPLSSIKGAISSSLFSILSPRSLDYEETSKSKEKRRSVAQFHLMEGAQYIVAFGHQKNTVIILGLDGSFYRCQFDPVKGGKMTQLEYHNFLKPEEERVHLCF